jgi:hypothetical protein
MIGCEFTDTVAVPKELAPKESFAYSRIVKLPVLEKVNWLPLLVIPAPDGYPQLNVIVPVPPVVELVNVIVLPTSTVAVEGVNDTLGSALTVTTLEILAVSPDESLTVAVTV